MLNLQLEVDRMKEVEVLLDLRHKITHNPSPSFKETRTGIQIIVRLLSTLVNAALEIERTLLINEYHLLRTNNAW